MGRFGKARRSYLPYGQAPVCSRAIAFLEFSSIPPEADEGDDQT